MSEKSNQEVVRKIFLIIIIKTYNFQESKHLLDVMRKTAEINDYDYRKMIKDFEATQRFENHYKKLKKQWAEESKKYQTNVEHMKEYREEAYKKKNNELVKKLNQKESILITSLENKNKDKKKENKKAFSLLMEKEKLAKENVEKFMEEQEKLRLIFEEETNLKRRSYII